MRFPAVIAFAAAVSLLLVACSGGDKTSSSSAGKAAATAVPRDSIVIPSVGIDAPVSLKRYQLNAALPSPDKAEDVALYDFPVATKLGGSPGAGGNVILAARSLSEIPCGAKPAPCEGAFFQLPRAKPGDRIDLNWQGKAYHYQVVSVCNVAAARFGDTLYLRTATEQLTLLTGIGTVGEQVGFSNVLIVIARPAPVTTAEPCPDGTNTGPNP